MVCGTGTWTRWGGRGNVRSSGISGSSETSNARKTIRSSSNSNESLSNSGIRLIRASQVRGRNLPLFPGGQKVVVPASHVPEELINQVQVSALFDAFCLLVNSLIYFHVP